MLRQPCLSLHRHRVPRTSVDSSDAETSRGENAVSSTRARAWSTSSPSKTLRDIACGRFAASHGPQTPSGESVGAGHAERICQLPKVNETPVSC